MMTSYTPVELTGSTEVEDGGSNWSVPSTTMRFGFLKLIEYFCCSRRSTRNVFFRPGNSNCYRVSMGVAYSSSLPTASLISFTEMV